MAATTTSVAVDIPLSPDHRRSRALDPEPRSKAAPFDLGLPAHDAYEQLKPGRDAVVEMGRRMAELTVMSVMPPLGYQPGDDVRGNNQSIGSQCLNNLASKFTFMAFPPGQPMLRYDPIEEVLQEKIDGDPEMWSKLQLALSRKEISHRKRAAKIGLATAWTGYMKCLLVAGNALWKHVTIKAPTFWRPDTYVVQRDAAGHPLVTIHETKVRVSTLKESEQEQVYDVEPELRRMHHEWEREVTLHSVCRFVRDEKAEELDGHWEFWVEHRGFILDGTDLETDYEDCPMWPGWLIPVYGSNWGRGYCEEYRGDLYSVEAAGSGLNDATAQAAWLLSFVKPGGVTSLRQVKKAPNLDIMSGNAEDITTLKSEKTGDFNFIGSNLDRAARRLGAAFLLQSAVRREGERVTAEEVSRIGQELEQATGGLYTEVGQGNQRRMISRFVRLHEEESPRLFVEGLDKAVDLQVVTGIDAMGRSIESQAMVRVAKTVGEIFPQQASAILKPRDFTRRLFASEGVKPDGLVATDEESAQEQEKAKQEMMQKTLLEKATGPGVKALGDMVTSSASATPPAQ